MENTYFSMLDGPPFSNGMPHFGHFMISAIKDAYYRFLKMQAVDVYTKPGWDCHGFPVENEIEKQFNLTSKSDILKFGKENFSKECRNSVFKYKGLWENLLKDLGRDLDYSDYYATVSDSYMESVWWAFKQCWDKGLVYKTRKPNLYSIKLESVVSNFEAQQNYKDKTETSVYVKFKCTSKNFTFLVWTTTPWTLPANQALAVNQNLDYAVVKFNNVNLVVAKDRLESLNLKSEFILKGSELVGLEYETIFDTYKKVSKVIHADFVSSEAGTGIVHLAPGFGEEDAKALPEEPIVHINPDGSFKSETNLSGNVFDNNILQILKDKNVLFKEEEITHSIPFCWRTDLPLIRYPVESWCLNVSKYRDKLVENNQSVNWVPDHIKDGRFGNWLKEVKDWNLSRDRIWGCQIPIYENEFGDVMCFGSFAELEQYVKPEDYHKPWIDKAVFFHPERPKEDKYLMKPVKYVFDCWFESGCAPFAQFHFPFENKEMFEKTFPADFIVEGIDQTRGWFYSLMVLSTILFDKAPYKNVIVTGHIGDENGIKFSKKNKNYIPASELLEKYGADTIRMYFYTSSVYQAEGIKFNPTDLVSIKNKYENSFVNIVKYFQTYNSNCFIDDENIVDKLCLNKAKVLVREFHNNFMKFNILKSTGYIYELLEFVSNFYIKNNRDRFVNGSRSACNTLEQMIKYLVYCFKPLMPNMVKDMEYDFPYYNTNVNDSEELHKLEELKKLIDMNSKIRSRNKIPMNKKVKCVSIVGCEFSLEEFQSLKEFLMFDEINFKDSSKKVAKPNPKQIGKQFPTIAQELFKKIKAGEYQPWHDNSILVNDIVLDGTYFTYEKVSDEFSETSGNIFMKIDNTYSKELELDYEFKQFKKELSNFRKSLNLSINDYVELYYVCSDELRILVQSFNFKNTNLRFSGISKEFNIFK